MGGPFGIDMGAILAMTSAVDADTALMSEVLPAVEAAIIAAIDGDDVAEE